MSDTPRTDEVVTYVQGFAANMRWVHENFARQLERELNEEKRLHLLTLDVLKDTENRRKEQEAEIKDLKNALTLAKSFMLTDENDTPGQTGH